MEKLEIVQPQNGYKFRIEKTGLDNKWLVVELVGSGVSISMVLPKSGYAKIMKFLDPKGKKCGKKL